jgi:hypothetical protein
MVRFGWIWLEYFAPAFPNIAATDCDALRRTWTGVLSNSLRKSTAAPGELSPAAKPALRGTTGGVEKSGSGLNCTDFGIFGIF